MYLKKSHYYCDNWYYCVIDRRSSNETIDRYWFKHVEVLMMKWPMAINEEVTASNPKGYWPNDLLLTIPMTIINDIIGCLVCCVLRFLTFFHIHVLFCVFLVCVTFTFSHLHSHTSPRSLFLQFCVIFSGFASSFIVWSRSIPLFVFDFTFGRSVYVSFSFRFLVCVSLAFVCVRSFSFFFSRFRSFGFISRLRSFGLIARLRLVLTFSSRLPFRTLYYIVYVRLRSFTMVILVLSLYATPTVLPSSLVFGFGFHVFVFALRSVTVFVLHAHLVLRANTTFTRTFGFRSSPHYHRTIAHSPRRTRSTTPSLLLLLPFIHSFVIFIYSLLICCYICQEASFHSFAFVVYSFVDDIRDHYWPQW